MQVSKNKLGAICFLSLLPVGENKETKKQSKAMNEQNEREKRPKVNENTF